MVLKKKQKTRTKTRKQKKDVDKIDKIVKGAFRFEHLGQPLERLLIGIEPSAIAMLVATCCKEQSMLPPNTTSAKNFKELRLSLEPVFHNILVKNTSITSAAELATFIDEAVKRETKYSIYVIHLEPITQFMKKHKLSINPPSTNNPVAEWALGQPR